MVSLSFTQFSLVPRICRWDLNVSSFPCMHLVKIQEYRVNKKGLLAVSRNKVSDSIPLEISDGEAGVVEEKTRKTRKRASARTRKKVVESADENPLDNVKAIHEESVIASASTEISRKSSARTQKKEKKNAKFCACTYSPTSDTSDEAPAKTTTRRRVSKKEKPKTIEPELSNIDENPFSPPSNEQSECDLELNIDNAEDISFTYGWPPLVCCFGAAQNLFLPAGRRANRLIDHEIHERKKDVLWMPEKFVRASGGCSSNVAVALASLGGKVAFMGKLGKDAYGQSLLYFLNENNVQTRSVRIDKDRATGVSRMRIWERDGLRVGGVRLCAEDCLARSEINIDVLREAKMFYFNSFSLLDRNMRSTTLQAIRIAKKLGNVVFYDLNLPLPLWQSFEETNAFIQAAWDLSDIIEVTKQELEFLCGITPSEKFDTKDNDKSKFTHYAPEIVKQLWHENLKVLFVTNGTSKIHYYTEENDGFMHGVEDAPITPYTSDMSASGDGIVAGLLRMLTVQPHLISDTGYLEKSIKYAISCGAIDQWLQARRLGYPAKEGMEDVEPDPHGIKSVTEKQYRTLVPSKS
ncbi:fructokinase-like 2 [Striga asiatica]|uniref:Fructokinase-like 2 n=1 Tax=Striga asiatica TaxID=4170 RepID=A0A5A7PGI0_STRAF|nr:fructokinase-like 2 [Striga asiatica]